MSTRGIFGVRVDGIDKLSYNHFDSYPENLGSKIVGYVKCIEDLDKEIEKARNLELVNSNDYPNIHQAKKYNLDTDSIFYNHLHKYQGCLYDILNLGVMCGDNDFILDSLFCEWGYIVNFDTQCLEVYRGCIKIKHNRGRYACLKKQDDGKKSDNPYIKNYQPCALLKLFKFNAIPNNWMRIVNTAALNIENDINCQEYDDI